jgi:UDP:flavonoid glycosyltransferase YjiC (YdhE family)
VKFVLACYGSRGDIVPSAAVGSELLRRGHEVCVAVPPNFVGFVESAGLAAVAYGLDTRIIVEMQRMLATGLFRNCCRIPDLIRLWRQQSGLGSQCWGEMNMRLTSLADGADLLVTSPSFERPRPTSRNITTFR